MAGWRWAKLDTTYFSNPKIVGLSPWAKLLHLSAIAYCVEHTTDGFVPTPGLKVCADRVQIRRDSRNRRCTELVTAGLLIEVDGGWWLHDFEDMNPQAMTHAVEAERKKARERKARSRLGGHAVTDHYHEEHVTDTRQDKTRQDLYGQVAAAADAYLTLPHKSSTGPNGTHP